MIRIAAAGDVHYDRKSTGRLASPLKHLAGQADILLLAGDLTQTGHIEEGRALAADLALSPIPVVAVLGNHDYHMDHDREMIRVLEDAGVLVLDKKVYSMELDGGTIGIVGLKGFGGGFVGACASDFGEREMKTFVQYTKADAEFIRNSLCDLDTDYKVVLLHYAPVQDTLLGEKREIYPFLGSYLLGEAADEGGADLIFHGHAHAGVEKGITPGGIPVRNVAQPVIRHAFNIYNFTKQGIIAAAGLAPRPTAQVDSHL